MVASLFSSLSLLSRMVLSISLVPSFPYGWNHTSYLVGAEIMLLIQGPMCIWGHIYKTASLPGHRKQIIKEIKCFDLETLKTKQVNTSRYKCWLNYYWEVLKNIYTQKSCYLPRSSGLTNWNLGSCTGVFINKILTKNI